MTHEHLQKAERMATLDASNLELPSNWDYSSPGWLRYTLGNDNCWKREKVELPLEEDVFFDTEVAVKDGPGPIIAIALSSEAWYSWCSPSLFLSDEERNTQKQIPFYNPPLVNFSYTDTSKPQPQRLIIGHAISFDRARIQEEYNINGSNFKFLDTLSLHSAVSGLSGQQRIPWNLKKKKDAADQSSSSNEDIKWFEMSGLGNLADAYELHTGKKLDKSLRKDLFIKGTLQDIKENLESGLKYCANDVKATAEIYSKLWVKFRRKSPHPVSFLGLLQMNNFYLPISADWPDWVHRCESLMQNAKESAEAVLKRLANSTVETHKTSYMNDPWLNQLDWTPLEPKYTKPKLKKDGTFAKNGEPKLYGNINPKLIGKPAWWRDMYDSKEGDIKITPCMKIVPLLLRLQWNGSPVYYVDDFKSEKSSSNEKHPQRGWAFICEDSSIDKCCSIGGVKFNFIPHSSGDPSAGVGGLISKPFYKFFEKNILSADASLSENANDALKHVLECSVNFGFWTSYRQRIRDQFVVWKKDSNVGKYSGVILPSVIPMGTVTRRAVEPTWMTASNPKSKIVGSEMKSKIVAPEGFKFVGADVDAEELWIASLFGDAQFGFHGATALGWMTLQGTKNEGTDLHSKSASILGMSRNEAKIFNYGRIYGAGVTFAAELLKKFNPMLAKEEAKEKAKALYKATKGSASYGTNSMCKWAGGTESYMFNQLEAVANSKIPRTPVLKAEISDALIPEYINSDEKNETFMTSRINWTVQSSGVDYLHLLIAGMSYLLWKYNIPGRLCITIHDELRWMVPESYAYKTALALQISNVWTRALFAKSVGINDLPLSVAFFSSVDIDKVVRKETFLSCTTPSSTEPVENGESLDINKLLEIESCLGDVFNEIPSRFNGARFTENYDNKNFLGYFDGKAFPSIIQKKDPNFLKIQIESNTTKTTKASKKSADHIQVNTSDTPTTTHHDPIVELEKKDKVKSLDIFKNGILANPAYQNGGVNVAFDLPSTTTCFLNK